jgi:hypothetical protein
MTRSNLFIRLSLMWIGILAILAGAFVVLFA